MTIALLNAERRWVCPNCAHTRVTTSAEQHVVIHVCPGLGGLTAPLVPDGTDCRVVRQDREDFLGRDIPQIDDQGQPAMAVVTEYADGRRDTMVLAPLAVGGGASSGLDRI